ncbi:hypothetical protein [Algoriphagus algorifonticola]|uniref:hypothetical protein n=1 Tax=Algoriphagus algorifonticola TaxID=2593007 RepID=UPI0011A4428D|nr:hypothetical protein [Algoriphagus algorifonticola]
MEKDFIKDEEILYRAVKSYSNWWKEKENRPSSAAFKDSRGVSVDRDFGKEESDIVRGLKKRFEVKAVVKIETLFCRKIGAKPMPKPIPKIPEHAEIHRSDTIIELTSSQARSLAKNCKIVFSE